MIELYIYSDEDRVRAHFLGLKRSKYYRVTVLPRDELQEAAACVLDGVIVYLDVSGCEPQVERKKLRFLASLGCAWGIADPEGRVEDPAELFHMGAADYISPACFDGRLKAARMHRVVEFASPFFDADMEEPSSTPDALPQGGNYMPSGSDWSAVQPGREYTFFFLYIELLPGEEWKVKSGDRNRKEIQRRFEQCVRRRVSPLQGEIWMWSEWGGVVLFPYSGEDSSPVILAARLMLNRPLVSLEEIGVESLADYRLALHVGNTLYNPRGETGTIISDDLNFLFHLGKKQAEPNTFYVTESAYGQVPPRLRPLFSEIDTFEGRELYRMRRFMF